MEKNNPFAEVSSDSFAEMLQPFQEMMLYYECAMLEVKTKIEVLDKEFGVRYMRDPVKNIKMRIKKPLSIFEKLERLGLPREIDVIEKNIHDIAGIRIVCSFIDDIYAIANLLTGQDDVKLLQTKDYIENPKPNGYRSLHLLVEVPIFLSNQKKPVCVEIQIRTVAMDFWASIEHDIKYKKDVSDRETITESLRLCAESIATLDSQIQDIGRTINGNM